MGFAIFAHLSDGHQHRTVEHCSLRLAGSGALVISALHGLGESAGRVQPSIQDPRHTFAQAGLCFGSGGLL